MKDRILKSLPVEYIYNGNAGEGLGDPDTKQMFMVPMSGSCDYYWWNGRQSEYVGTQHGYGDFDFVVEYRTGNLPEGSRK